MARCIDCANFVKEKCTILKSVLAFSPDSEVVCPAFKVKKGE